MVDTLIVRPGTAAGIAERDPGDGLGLRKQEGEERLGALVERIDELQYRLFAEDRSSVLLVLQGLDASGKDGVVRRVFHGVNPAGVSVTSFRAPVGAELEHDYLWRIHAALPARGRIGVFNRSHYEDVAVVRVHPELLENAKLPEDAVGPDIWKHRYESINAFERHLHRNGTQIIKFFLHVSKEEQKKRFLKRLEDPEKHWKFNPSDIAERAFWDDYMQAYEDALTATSKEWAPWYVIPADRKPVMQAMVAAIIARTIRDMNLRWPKLSPEKRQGLDEARKKLEAE
jgi:PPK2 family polyphosphate:nucleotide phosphotransferase